MAITHDACCEINPSQDLHRVHSTLVLSKLNCLYASWGLEIHKIICCEAAVVRIHVLYKSFPVFYLFDLHHAVKGISLTVGIARRRVAEEIDYSVVWVERVDLMLKESNQLGQVLQAAQAKTPVAIADMDMEPCRQVPHDLEV